MNRILLLTLIASLTVGGWASAQKQELLSHASDVHMQQMDDNSCSSNSNSSGGQ
jgi:hypothetical protein